jgi:hypothetical protein
VLTLDTAHPNDWANDVIIIDECDQVFWHLLNSGTEVQKRRVSGHHLLCCSAQKAKSKWGTQALEERFRRKYPHLRILRIDSESVTDPSHAAFGCIAHLNEILTSLETGVSIDIRGYFDSVWGIFQGVQSVNSVRQMLARLRETVDRHIWVREWGMSVVGFSVKLVNQP